MSRVIEIIFNKMCGGGAGAKVGDLSHRLVEAQRRHWILPTIFADGFISTKIKNRNIHSIFASCYGIGRRWADRGRAPLVDGPLDDRRL